MLLQGRPICSALLCCSADSVVNGHVTPDGIIAKLSYAAIVGNRRYHKYCSLYYSSFSQHDFTYPSRRSVGEDLRLHCWPHW